MGLFALTRRLSQLAEGVSFTRLPQAGNDGSRVMDDVVGFGN